VYSYRYTTSTNVKWPAERVIFTSMEGFYDKNQVANLLGISTRQVTNYLKEDRLRKVYSGRKVWIPQEDVHGLYENIKKGLLPSREELTELIGRVQKIEETLEVLKLGLGFGSKKRQRTEAELLILRQEFLDELAQPGWSIRRMSEVADTTMSLNEEDLLSLCNLKGEVAWSPLFDLINRMVPYIEQHESYPERGLGTLHSRLCRAKDRLLGLISAATKVPTGLPKKEALSLREQLDIKPGFIDVYIAKYIASRA